MPKQQSPYPWHLESLFAEKDKAIEEFNAMISFDNTGREHQDYFKIKLVAIKGVSHCVHIFAMLDSLSQFLFVNAVLQNLRGRKLA